VVIGRHDQRAFGVPRVLASDGVQPYLAVRNLVHAALRVELLDGVAHLPARQVGDDDSEGGILLAHDVVEANDRKAGLLELLIGPTGLHGLVLADVADEVRCGPAG